MVHIRSKRHSVKALLAFAAVSFSPAAAALNVFACEPEWAALVRDLAPAAKVVSATHVRQDPHYIEARPSLIAQLRRADLAICTGAELEAGWLPVLQQRAGNPKVQAGQVGMMFVSELVELIDQTSQADRADGHVHAGGNPHFHLDPGRLAQVADALSTRLQAIDPDRAPEYQAAHTSWAQRWDKHVARWKQSAAPLRDRTVVAQHSSFAYLWHWLGMEQTADLEPKPGLPPTPAHLASLVGQVQAANPIAIVQTLYQDKAPVLWLQQRTGVPSLSLPSTVTKDGDASTLNGLFDLVIGELLALPTVTN